MTNAHVVKGASRVYVTLRSGVVGEFTAMTSCDFL